MNCPVCGGGNTQPADTPQDRVCIAQVKYSLGRGGTYCLEPNIGSLWCNDCFVPFEGEVYGDPLLSRTRVITLYRPSPSK